MLGLSVIGYDVIAGNGVSYVFIPEQNDINTETVNITVPANVYLADSDDINIEIANDIVPAFIYNFDADDINSASGVQFGNYVILSAASKQAFILNTINPQLNVSSVLSVH